MFSSISLDGNVVECGRQSVVLSISTPKSISKHLEVISVENISNVNVYVSVFQRDNSKVA
jgi:hypothetical protein